MKICERSSVKATVRNHKQSGEAPSVEAEVKEQRHAWTQAAREKQGDVSWRLMGAGGPTQSKIYIQGTETKASNWGQ